jgi:hypothetical protein
MSTTDFDIYIVDGILFLKSPRPFVMDLLTAQNMIEQRLSISNGKSFPALADFTQMQYLTKDARRFFSGKRGEEGLIAGAFITTSVISRVLVNSYLTVYKPNIPTKMFNDEKAAVKWLSQFVEK